MYSDKVYSVCNSSVIGNKTIWIRDKIRFYCKGNVCDIAVT